MPFNGSGSYSLSDTIANGTPNDADELQAILDDLAAGVSNAVCVDGQSTMTGVLKNSNGSAAAPSITFGSDTNTGFYRKAADDLGVAVAGAIVANFDTNGLTLASGKALGGSNIVVTANITDNAVTLAKLATQADGTILANVSGSSASPAAATITSVIDKISSTQGVILYRGAASWSALATGTADYVLTTQGAGANPVWKSAASVALPTQSGNSGKLLQSDGSSASWSGDSAVRVRASLTSLTGTPAIGTGAVNVASCTIPATGSVRVNFTTPLASTNYQVETTVTASGGFGLCVSGVTKNTDYCIIAFIDLSSAARTPSAIDFVVYGGF